MAEFLAELREHWDDQYWWADHQELRVVLLSILSGVIGLGFVWLELKLKASHGQPG